MSRLIYVLLFLCLVSCEKEIDIDYETVLKKTGEFIGTITDVGKELAKTAFSSNADLLRSIADSIDPDEKEKL